MDIVRRQILLVIATVAIVAAACAAAGTSTSPSPSPDPGPITTEAQAVARVIAHEPRFTGITERDPDMIGQAAWYDVEPASGVGVFIVTMRLGWGDCPAGCIDEHSWVYAIGPDGAVTLQSEGGPVVPPDAWPAPGGLGGATGLLITGVAGPTCPVEQIPPDPNCAPRPVAGATIFIRDAQGNDARQATLDATGSALVELPPGDYVVTGGAVDGLMGAPEAQQVVVVEGATSPVVLAYDTGIR